MNYYSLLSLWWSWN